MKSFDIEEGLYAVFKFKGLSTDSKLFEYIFSKWIPKSIYAIDDRPHFEILEKNIVIMPRIQMKKFGFHY